MEIFKKEYDGESIYDLSRDISEAIIEDYNPVLSEIPQDEHGFQQGMFEVTITWKPDEE